MTESKDKVFIPIKFDLVFKKIFGNDTNKLPLIGLLKYILKIEPKEITILNSEIIGSNYYNKRTTVDLIVELEDKTKIVIEMNTNVNRELINRNLFYMFKIMSKDLKVKEKYKNLRKHIQINFDCEGSHSKPIEKYKIIEEETGKVLTDKVEIIRISIPYYTKRCYNKDINKLDEKDKFIGLIGLEDRKLASKVSKGDKYMEEMYEQAEKFSDDEEILGAYDYEWHRQEVERTSIEAGYERGMQQGLEDGIKEGMQQGIEQGIEQGKLETAKNMLKENIGTKIISKVTGITIEKINNLK